MPRNVFDIKDFKYGVISSLDEEDIPSESASDSLNVDGDSAEGILRGIPADSEYLTNGNNALVDIRLGELIENGGVYDLIYHNSNANKIICVNDFHNSTVSSRIKKELITSNISDNTTIVTNNKEVHIGTGYASTNVPKWVGHCDFGQFNAGTTWTISNATNANPVVVTVGGTITSVADFSGTVAGTVLITTENDHGLATNQRVVIAGTTDYNGTFTVTIVASDTFYITETYTSSQTGTFTVYHSLKDGNLVTITGVAGNTAANGIWIVASSNPVAGTFAIDTAGNSAYTSGGTVNQYLCIEDAKCRNYTDTTSPADGYFDITATATTGTGTKFFLSRGSYYYAMSYVYDGYQESPLITDSTPITRTPYDNTGYVATTPSADAEYYTVTITAKGGDDNLDVFNKRITGINLYRADSPDITLSSRGLFRMIAYIDINGSSWTPNSGDRVITVTDYGITTIVGSNNSANLGAVSYEENAGIGETLSNTIVNYSLAAKGNGYLFVGKGYKMDLPHSDRYIFRSKYLRYDMFNWIDDFLIMPEPITAMHFYDGKLFVFSLNKTYRINPDGLYIEDVFDDAGAIGQRAVHSNEYGMFFGNSINAWMYRNGSFSPIGDAIRQSASGGKSWQTFLFSTLTDLIVTSDSKKGYVLFINERTDTTTKLFAWAYSPSKKRWDAWAFGGYASSANAGAFKGKDGEVYLSNASATYKLMRPVTSTYTQLWEWYSQELSFGETRQKKSLVMIKLDSTGTVGITYGVDGATPATSGTSEALINVYNKSIRVKLNGAAVSSGSAYTNYVDSMELIYRPLVGAR